jgi:hypothetical protein
MRWYIFTIIITIGVNMDKKDKHIHKIEVDNQDNSFANVIKISKGISSIELYSGTDSMDKLYELVKKISKDMFAKDNGTYSAGWGGAG